MKLGSLFDGSGGFPLAGSLCGIEPAWAAEVEPYPIAVTRSRFPCMKHLGDISKVNGADIEPVDIITFGSPCQDLSVAGKRAGLKHIAVGDEETTRSGLFMEAVRIIKEMREATGGEYPRFALWENVLGAFSSQKGEDFRVVLEELIRIVEPGAIMPAVPKAGWAYADSYSGDGWSLAYRVFDAQYWGVPQRRRRIHLVVDFRGQCAREILFEREGVRGYFAEGRTPWKETAGEAQNSVGANDREGASTGGDGDGRLDAVAYTLKIRSGVAVDSKGKAAGKGALVQTEKPATLATTNDQYLFQPTAYSFDSLASNSMKSSNPHSGCRQVEVAKTLDTTNPNPCKNQGGTAVVAFAQNQRDEVRYLGDKAGSLQAQPGMKQQTFILDSIGGQAERGWESDIAPTLKASHYKFPPSVAVGAPAGFCTEPSEKSRSIGCAEWTAPTLRAGVTPAVVYNTGGNGAGATIGLSGGKIAPTLISGMTTATGTTQDNLIVCAPALASGKDTTGCLMVSGYDKLGAQEMFSGDYTIIEPTCVCIEYIVRRLTPTECARLQGFADRWGNIDKRDSFTPEEYDFWLNVRNTHAVINGKKVMGYTEEQMLTWYNKLHTDSAEYKMWGNGIALPPALYCMQGIADALTTEKEDDWMN